MTETKTLTQTQPFVIERIFNAPVDKVWKAITSREEMKQWYFDIADFKPEVGFEFQFTAGCDGKTHVHLCRITNVTERREIAYTWRYEGYEGDSLVTFELFEEGENTRLKLTHEGLETFPKNNPDFAKKNFAEGWTEIIGTSLKKWVENAKQA